MSEEVEITQRSLCQGVKTDEEAAKWWKGGTLQLHLATLQLSPLLTGFSAPQKVCSIVSHTLHYITTMACNLGRTHSRVRRDSEHSSECGDEEEEISRG